MNINGATNMVYLPVVEGIHPTKMVHHEFKLNGKPHAEYNAYMRMRLDELEEHARFEQWDQERANKEALNLQHETRSNLNRKPKKASC